MINILDMTHQKDHISELLGLELLVIPDSIFDCITFDLVIANHLTCKNSDW